MSINVQEKNRIIIRDKYMIISQIGQGNFGKVFKALNIKIKNSDDESNKYVAIKIENLKTLSNFKILKHETTILNYLNKNKCNNIPLVHWYGSFNQIPCLVIPFYNYSLTQYITNLNYQEDKNISNYNLKMIRSMLEIINHCHELYVIHRDLKPDNFMFNHKDELILIDFGLATFIYQDTLLVDISEKHFIGNIIYASPNVHQLKKADKIDDIISISYIYLLIYLGGSLPWMNINGNSEIKLEDESKFSQILNLKKIQNINLSKKNDDKIFEFIQNAYDNNMSYDF
jgi:serine/threonine protein kinase